ncbi:MAG: hypothetical protein AAFQ96_00475 [Pseudomonadota bacterium]
MGAINAAAAIIAVRHERDGFDPMDRFAHLIVDRVAGRIIR